nr:ORF3 [Torque teno felis virus]
MMLTNRHGQKRKPKKVKLTRRIPAKKRRLLDILKDDYSESSLSAENSSVSLDSW